jgi:hypothetical protein
MELRHTQDVPPAFMHAATDVYGWARIWAGSWFLSDLDPYWWREGGFVPATLGALDMADPRRCMLAWWAVRYLPDPPPRGPRQVPPYDRAVRALHLSSMRAQALGFTGVDADLLTAGWRHLITCLRASRDGAVDIARVELSGPSMAAGLRLAVWLQAASES